MFDDKPKPRLSINFAINVAGAIAPLAIALITVPIIVSHIGTARYGVMSIVWVLLGYLGFLDLGLSRASINALSRLPLTARRERSQIVATSFLVNLVLASLGAVILYFAGSFLLLDVFTVPAELEDEIRASLPYIASLLPLALLSGFAIGIIESRERFFLTNLLQVGSLIVGQIAPVVCAILIGPQLSVVIPAATLSRALSVVLFVALALRAEQGFRLDRFALSKVRSLLSYGGWVTVSAVVTPVLNTLDQIVIGRLLGVSAVAYYSVPMNLVMRSQLFTNALARTLFPRLSSLERAEAIGISERALIVSGILYAGVCAGGIFLIRPFLDRWMGSDFATAAAGIAVVLLVGVWVNALTFAPFTLLQGQGRPDITAKLHAAQAVPYVALLVVLTGRFGLMGAAAAFACRAVVDCGVLIALSPLPSRRIFLGLLPSALLVAFAALLQVPLAGSTPALLAAAVLAGLVSLALLRAQEEAVFERIRLMVVALLRWPVARYRIASRLPARRPSLPV